MEFLIPPPDEPDEGKTLSALRRSRGGHAAMIALFGGSEHLPTSILRTKRVRADAARDAVSAERNYADCGTDYKKKLVSDESLPGAVRGMARMLDYRGDGSGAISKFPQDVGRTVVLFYSEPGDLVVDPFAGHNSRMELCVRAGRDYAGCDLSAQFMEFNRTRARQLKAEFPHRKIRLFETDSRTQPVPDAAGDFTITSPPYWDIEYYGPEAEQLGNARTYDQFLADMTLVLAENYRTLKPGAFSCWFINDFRKKGKMYFYHRDLLGAGESVGFTPHDIIVVDLGRGLRDGFVNEAVRTKIIPKRHEYVIVFKKPQ
jgi:hypothetical protein